MFTYVLFASPPLTEHRESLLCYTPILCPIIVFYINSLQTYYNIILYDKGL